MNKISQNGMSITQTSTHVIINGKKYEIPDYVRSKYGNRISMRNGRIVINGYLFDPDTGKFSRSIPWFAIFLVVAALTILFLL